MKWDLTNYYKTYEDFKESLKKANEVVDKLPTFKGKLNDKESFKEYLHLEIEFIGYERLYLYAECKMDLDRRVQENLSDMQEVMFLFSKFDANTSWENSEVLSLGKEYCLETISEDKGLEQFRHGFEDLFRKVEHIPSADAQSVLANFSLLENSGSEIYGALTSGDVKESLVTLDNGEKVNVTHANWTDLISKGVSEAERQRIFEGMFNRFDQYKNTYAAIYDSVVQADVAEAKSKGFKSALEMHLYKNNIPTSLYHNLIAVAHKAAPIVKEYIKLRKEKLGLSEYHTYDRFLTFFKDTSSKHYSYPEALDLFYKSIAKFPKEFNEFAREATKEGYVDVMPGEAKRSGAYSNSTPNTHPCILLNFQENLDSCFTLAHEAGHSTHTMFSNSYQPTLLQSYTIFVAEIASTFNEHNLLDYLLNSGTLSKNEKIALIENALDGIMGTFYRQTLFGEYELKAHALVENGEGITADKLSKIMIDLYQEYYGLDIEKEKVKKFVWAYIPHLFNSPYYVYQYATSYSASLAIYSRVKSGDKEAFDNYIELLKSGCSDYPIELVKKAGVDFTKADALEGVVKRFDELFTELKELFK